MKLLAYAPITRPNTTRVERRPAASCVGHQPPAKRRPVSRFVLVEDLDHLYRTGESRQILVLRWTR